MKKKLIIMLIISLAAHITIAGTLIYIPSYLSNNNRGFDDGRVIWGIVSNKSPGTGDGGSGHGVLTTSVEKDETLTSLRLTKDDENNPPIPPLEKGGKGGFERLFSSEEYSQNAKTEYCNDLNICTEGDAVGDNINIENISVGSWGNNSIDNGIVAIGSSWGSGGNGGYGGYGNNPSGGHNRGDELKRFLNSVRNEIERNKYYPHIAKVSELEGTVYVNFHIDEKGIPGSIAVGRSSGIKLLDDSAVSTIKKIRHFKGVPSEIRELDITVPITYRLTKEDKE